MLTIGQVDSGKAANVFTSSGLVGYWHPGIALSAPTGSNGNTWVNLANYYSIAGTYMGNVNIQGLVSDWTYGGSGRSAYVQNFNQTRTGTCGMPVSLTGFNKLIGTLEMWVNPTVWTGQNGFFMNRTNDTANDINWFWAGVWDNGNTVYFRTGFPPGDCCSNDMAPGNGATFNALASNTVSVYMPTNKWYQVVFTWDHTLPLANQYKQMYINGTLVHSRVGMPGQPTSTNVESTGTFGAGHSNTGSQWVGRIGITRMYNRVLSTSEISLNFANARRVYEV